MNPIYAILESPHRWSILAAIAFGTGFVGTMAMLAWGWPHAIPLVWFYAGLLTAAYSLVRAVLDWRARVEASLQAAERQPVRRIDQGENQSTVSSEPSAPQEV